MPEIDLMMSFEDDKDHYIKWLTGAHVNEDMIQHYQKLGTTRLSEGFT